MSELVPREPGSSMSRASSGCCAYCGAPLHAMFYFCTGCGTPYKDISAVLAPSSPPILGEAELIRIKAPWAMGLFWTYFAVILGSAVVAALAFHDDRPDLRIFLADTAILVTTCIFAVRYWPTLRVQLARFGFNHPVALAGLASLVPLLIVNFAYSSFLTQALDVEDALPLNALREAGVGEITLVALFCVLPAVTEEIALRGLLQHWLAVAIHPFRALVLASFLFALLHLSILSFPYLFAVGMVLGWVKWRTGSLYPCMLIHFLHNLAVIELF